MIEEIKKWVPHRGQMLLLSNIVDKSESHFVIQVKITKDSFLYEESRGIPSYCAIEYMAQSIAAYNSIHLKGKRSESIGFIIAVRDFNSSLLYYEAGYVLNIIVKPVLVMENSGVFDCQAILEDEEVASGRITAYVPTKDELIQLKESIYA